MGLEDHFSTSELFLRGLLQMSLRGCCRSARLCNEALLVFSISDPGAADLSFLTQAGAGAIPVRASASASSELLWRVLWQGASQAERDSQRLF